MQRCHIEQGIPAREQQRVHSLFHHSLCPMDFAIDTKKSDFSVTNYKQVCLNGIDIVHDEGPGFRQGIRKPHHIIDSPSDDYLLALPLDAQVRFIQSGEKSCFTPGSFTLLSTARPFTAAITTPNRQMNFSAIMARISAPLLRQKIPYIDKLCGLPIQIGPGVGNIMHAQIELALLEGGSLSEYEIQHFSNSLIDSIADTIISAPEITHSKLKSRGTAKNKLLEQAHCFILANLSNPVLDSGLIASECKVSVRYLRAAFETSPHTISSFIRKARLKQCHEALINPLMIHQSITEIAMLWGFNDASYFSRSYREYFGESARETRNKIS